MHCEGLERLMWTCESFTRRDVFPGSARFSSSLTGEYALHAPPHRAPVISTPHPNPSYRSSCSSKNCDPHAYRMLYRFELGFRSAVTVAPVGQLKGPVGVP